jgi:PhzF family phenazine biosynthesis protein
MRFFAPSLGITEDPVTGSANGPMAVYLWENGLLDKKKKYFSFKASQGRFVGRPGLVTVNMTISQGVVDEVQIAGQAVTVIDGTMVINANMPEKL